MAHLDHLREEPGGDQVLSPVQQAQGVASSHGVHRGQRPPATRTGFPWPRSATTAPSGPSFSATTDGPSSSRLAASSSGWPGPAVQPGSLRLPAGGSLPLGRDRGDDLLAHDLRGRGPRRGHQSKPSSCADHISRSPGGPMVPVGMHVPNSVAWNACASPCTETGAHTMPRNRPGLIAFDLCLILSSAR